MMISAILKGMASYIPGLYDLAVRLQGTGPLIDTKYCYTAWLSHVSQAIRHNFPLGFKCVAELGPGDCLGAGLLTVLCGAERYYALDSVQFTHSEENIDLVDPLAEMLKQRTEIPGMASVDEL